MSLPRDFVSRKLGLSFVGHGTYFGVTGTELSGQVGAPPLLTPIHYFRDSSPKMIHYPFGGSALLQLMSGLGFESN